MPAHRTAGCPLHNPCIAVAPTVQLRALTSPPCPPPAAAAALLQMGGMLDEASLELFESQSHLLDPDSLAALQKQRQLLDWRHGSAGDEAGTLAAAASMERQDSAGSGNEPLEVR